MVLLHPNVLWHKGLQERFYYNAELLCEELDVIFTSPIKKKVSQKI
jgi:hypothetical protein